jgi:hypothetical protein
MSKHEKRHLRDSLGKRSSDKVESEVSPHNSRIIPEVLPLLKAKIVQPLRSLKGEGWRRNAPFLIVTGLLILIFFNLWYQSLLPDSVQVLLENPYDTAALQSVLKNSNDPRINGEIIAMLSARGEDRVAAEVQTEKNRLYEMVNKITLLLKEHADYADGYAYRSVLYFRLHECSQSAKDIQKAIERDPGRSAFIKLSTEIKRCQ